MNPMVPDIDVEPAYLESGRTALLIKAATDSYELNIFVDMSEVDSLISFLNGEDGDSYYGGQSGNNRALWRIDGEYLYILFGDDREAWDIGFTIDARALKEIADKLNSAKA